MIRTFAATAILAAAAAVAHADGSFERTVTVSANPDLYVSTGAGNIHITPGSESQIHIVAHLHGGWAAGRDADERIQRIIANPPIQQQGNTVRIGETTDRALMNNISIDYDITAPASVALNLRSGSGDVELNHLGRFVAAASGSGNVRAHGVKGPAELRSGSGDIELEDEAAGDVKASTGSGTIRVRGFSGGLNLRTGSGDIEAQGRLSVAARLVSGSGTVRLTLPQDAHFNLEASTGSGSIRVHFPNAPQQNEESRHHLTAAINGGGPTLEAHTGSGDIDVNGGGDNRSFLQRNFIHVPGAIDCADRPDDPRCSAR